MIHKHIFDRWIFCILCLFPIPNLSDLEVQLASFVPADLRCNHGTITSTKTGLNTLVAAAFCRVSPHHPRCFGIKCASNATNCQTVSRQSDLYLSCIDNPRAPEDPILISTNAIHLQTELAMVDPAFGLFRSASIDGEILISIPKTKEETPLQCQWGKSILACYLASTDCVQWFEGSKEWIKFPSLLVYHDQGTLNVVGDTPVVIGGKYPNTISIPTVEFYDKTEGKWILGPELRPERDSHSTVVVNETSLVIMGGLRNGVASNSVKILNIIDRTWKDLTNFPNSRYGAACGFLFDSNEVLCLGGEQGNLGMVKNAYRLSLSTPNEAWNETEKFKLVVERALGGFLFQLRSHLYCLTTVGENFTPLVKLRRMNLYDGSTTWTVVKQDFQQGHFFKVLPYVTTGYVIKS